MEAAFKIYLLWSEACEDIVTNQLQFSEERKEENVVITPLLEPGKCWGKSNLPRAGYKL